MRYFVAYKYPAGFGRCEITRDTPIASINDVAEVEESIMKDNDVADIGLRNWILLPDDSLLEAQKTDTQQIKPKISLWGL